MVATVTDGDFWDAIASIEPVAMGGGELTLFLAASAERAEVIALGVVAVEEVAAVTVADVPAAVWAEADVGGVEGFSFIVAVRLWWWTAFPDDVTFDGEFLRFVPFFRREAEIIGREVDKIIITFATDVDAMAVALVLGRHGADEFALGIEDENAAGAALVRDVNKPLAVNGDSVRGVAVMVAIRQLSPIMMALELECSVTDDWGGGGLGGLEKELGCA